jgi:hypothetical protein
MERNLSPENGDSDLNHFCALCGFTFAAFARKKANSIFHKSLNEFCVPRVANFKDVKAGCILNYQI